MQPEKMLFLSLDMDEIIIEGHDYYTDGTTSASDSDNDSDESLEGGVRDFEL